MTIVRRARVRRSSPASTISRSTAASPSSSTATRSHCSVWPTARIFAIDHIEPFTDVPVLARGLVGSVGDVATVSSPLHKQRFDLDTGRCVDDAAYAVGTWAVSVVDGVVTIGDRRPAAA